MAQKQHIHTKAQEEAQRYIQVHAIDKLVTSMVNSLVQAKPQDPYVAMLRFLAKRCSPAQLQEAGIAPKSRELQRGEQHVTLMQERERLLRLEQKLEAAKPAKKPQLVPPRFDPSGAWAQFRKGVEERQEQARAAQARYEAEREADGAAAGPKPEPAPVAPDGCTLPSLVETLCRGLREGEYEAGTVDPIEFQRLRSEELRERVEWAATHLSTLVHDQTPLRATFMMLVAFHTRAYAGEPWAAYLTERAIGLDSARDALGRSAADYASSVDSLAAPGAECWATHPPADATDALARLKAGVPPPEGENLARFFAELIARQAQQLSPEEDKQDECVKSLLRELVACVGKERLVHAASGATVLHALVAALKRESEVWLEEWTGDGGFEELDAEGRGFDEYADGWPGEAEEDDEEKEEEETDEEEDED